MTSQASGLSATRSWNIAKYAINGDAGRRGCGDVAVYTGNMQLIEAHLTQAGAPVLNNAAWTAIVIAYIPRCFPTAPLTGSFQFKSVHI